MSESADGWGRPRPKFADLSPSNPSDESSDDDGREPMDATPVADAPPSRERRVVPSVDWPLPGFDGVPVAELNRMYVHEGKLLENQTPQLNDFYTAWSNGDPKDPKFTCVFTCPVSGERFACGRWKNEGGVTERGVEHWYSKKKTAKAAAAGRALDCFSLRRCDGTGKRPFQRCEDEPYLKGNAPKLPDLPPGVVLPSRTLRRGDEGAPVAPPPKRALNDWYFSFCKRLDGIGIVLDDAPNEAGPRSESYDAWSNNLESPNTRFTAIYTCHLSGERFASGSLIAEEGAFEEAFCYYHKREGVLITNKEADAEGWDIDGVEEALGLQRVYFIWYKTKKKAIAAAAARAVDCLKYRDNICESCHAENHTYCKEDPYTAANAPELWKEISESVNQAGGVAWALLQGDDRLTTKFDVPDLHRLLDGESDVDDWRRKYRERRSGGRNYEV